jgi:alkaline phosphatase
LTFSSAAFSAHSVSRDYEDFIASQQVNQSIDVMFGGGGSIFKVLLFFSLFGSFSSSYVVILATENNHNCNYSLVKNRSMSHWQEIEVIRSYTALLS